MTNPNHAINPRKSPKQSRAAATVEAILEATAQILEQGGLAALNTNAVAQRAGVSIGSLYQYFPSKDALLAALLRRKREAMRAAFEAQRNTAPQQDLSTVLNGFIHAAITLRATRPLLASSLAQAEALLPLAQETKTLKEDIIGIIAKALADHGITDPKVAARDLAALTQGMIDAAGLFGETDLGSLEIRIRRAVYGYLGLMRSMN